MFTRKKNFYKLFSLIFLIITCTLATAFLSQKKSFRQKAAEGPLEISFDIFPKRQLKKFWTSFSQGGEERGLMLKPAEKEVKLLQPEFIRIDHIFDFGEIAKISSGEGKTTLDFTDLDKRVEEIVNLGATPFLSLSYFPSYISSNLIDFPPSLDLWEELAAKTIQRYSGKAGKNLSGIYYEVWNEPDLFGSMSPEKYFSLYQSSVNGGKKCTLCNPFKIGGPAITTLKKDWMENFLRLTKQNNQRIDFISFHSYQNDPQKTLWEITELKKINNSLGFSSAEIIISEWGSIPENSPQHDSFFDASHTIKAVNVLKNSGIDKLFAFELKDGPDPEGKKYWGRWGLLTHQNSGLSPKPRYYSFLYLDKLLNYELTPIQSFPEVSMIGSSDGKTNFSFVLANNSGLENPISFKLILNQLPPGKYISNAYIYDKLQDPMTPKSSEIILQQTGGNLNLSLMPYAISLIELTRTTASLNNGEGRTGQAGDFSARVQKGTTSLIYPVNQPENIQSGKISFLFKADWNNEENRSYYLLESNNENKGLSCWIEKKNFLQYLHFKLLNSGEELSVPIPPLNDNLWHSFDFYFDRSKSVFGLKLDQEQYLSSFDKTAGFPLDNLIFIGSNILGSNFSEGLIDNLQIDFNGQTYYQEDFNEEVATRTEVQ